MIFVDTGAWFSFCVPADADHTAAVDFMHRNEERLVTTDYVLDELLTLLRARNEYPRALSIGRDLLAGGSARLELVDLRDIESAWNVFESFRDKAWSFTDCVSYVVMKRLGIKKAFAFDEHFRQFGTVEILPG